MCADSGHPGCLFLVGVGTVCTGTQSLSAEPEAQLEEQVGKNEGGQLGWGPAIPTKFHTVSQAGPGLPRRKARNAK